MIGKIPTNWCEDLNIETINILVLFEFYRQGRFDLAKEFAAVLSLHFFDNIFNIFFLKKKNNKNKKETGITEPKEEKERFEELAHLLSCLRRFDIDPVLVCVFCVCCVFLLMRFFAVSQFAISQSFFFSTPHKKKSIVTKEMGGNIFYRDRGRGNFIQN